MTARDDGDNGFGHLVVNRATETAIAKARETGIAWVGIRGSNHAGRLGLCGTADGSVHDRHLLGGRQRQPYGAGAERQGNDQRIGIEKRSVPPHGAIWLALATAE